MILFYPKKDSKGFTLLEVLVAMVLLAIGLLGVARLQVFGLQNTGNAYFRTQASALLTELVERVRANPVGAQKCAYYLEYDPANIIDPPNPTPSCGTLVTVSNNCAVLSNCLTNECKTDPATAPAGSKLEEFDMYVTSCGLNGLNDGSGVDDLLPSGGMQIYCSKNNAADCLQYRATVSWSETTDEDGDGAGDTNTISFEFTP